MAQTALLPVGVDGTATAGVLFDFGNTLFAHAPLPTTIVDAAAELGVALPVDAAVALATEIDAAAMHPDEAVHRRDLDTVVWARRWSVHYGLADRVARGLGAAIYRSMHDPARWHPYRHTADVLAHLRRSGVSTALVSNTGWDVRAVLTHHGVRVDAVVLSCEVGVVKPAPEIFLAACDRLGVAPAATLMVGDDARADSGAVLAGLRTLLLPALPPGADNGLRAVLDIAGRR